MRHSSWPLVAIEFAPRQRIVALFFGGRLAPSEKNPKKIMKKKREESHPPAALIDSQRHLGDAHFDDNSRTETPSTPSIGEDVLRWPMAAVDYCKPNELDRLEHENDTAQQLTGCVIDWPPEGVG